MTSPHAAFRARLRELQRMAGRGQASGQGARMRALAEELTAAGFGALQIADLSARLSAALVRRLAGFFEAERGPAPVAWAWLALGSEGRREQPFPTDQDSALVLGVGQGGEEWGHALADRLVEDLDRAGLPPCAGGVTARGWQATLAGWCDRVKGWLADPAPTAVLSAAALADARRTAGRLDTSPLRAALASAAEHPRFLRELVRAALEFQPPGALPVRLGIGRLELAREGIAPLVLLARAYGLAVRSPVTGTCARLDAAGRAGLLDPEIARQAAEAFRLLAKARLQAQLQGGPGPVELRSLPPEEQRGLRGALGTVRRLQDRAARQFLE